MQTKENMKIKEPRVSTPIPFERASDTTVFYEILQRLTSQYRSIRSAEIGESIMGRSIPVVTLGENRTSRGVLFVGGLCGDDPYSPAVLLRFIRDYAEFLESGKRIYSVSMPYLYSNRTIHVIPMLNPDGYAIRRNGADDIPVRDRLLKQNGGADFSSWKYNARGVALWENFTDDSFSDYCGVRAESEPETAALCRYIRMTENGIYGNIELAMELHGRNSYMRCTSGDISTGEISASRSKTVARLLSRMTGCEVKKSDESRGELTDFFLREFGRPAFSCGFFDGSAERKSAADEYLRIYAAFREALFSAPLLI